MPPETFVPVTGTLDLRPHAAAGTTREAELLAAIDLNAFYEASSDAARIAIVQPFLERRHVRLGLQLEESLFDALENFPALGLLINTTMKEARPVKELGEILFPDAPAIADNAVTVLMALGSMARRDPTAPALLPCRIHTFFRGLPGLWVCTDHNCTEIPSHQRGGICGRMYGQPHERCDCGARVLELYTCRYCGTAYARAYSDDLENPSALWSEAGRRLHMEGGQTSPLLPLDLLLEEPALPELAEPADYDVETGRLNPHEHGSRMRRVYLRRDRISPPASEDGTLDASMETRGQFIPCAVCNETARFGRATVQDHQTKGDQPFEALVAKQLQVQPPAPVEPSRFAPFRGRKVLVFSDSRQVAARLAPNLQMYSVRDSVRPLIAWGYKRLQQISILRPLLSLDDLYLAVLLASKKLEVRLRPELKSGESFAAEDIVELAVRDGGAETDHGLQFLCMKLRTERPPEALLDDIVKTVQDRFLGFEALALASIAERDDLTSSLAKLPAIPGLIETPEAKIGLARAWLRCWRSNGFWLNAMPPVWWLRPRTEGTSVRGQRGRFKAMDDVLKGKVERKIFTDSWTPELLRLFTEDMGGVRRLRGANLSLLLEGDWVRCRTCKSVHRPVPGLPHCLDCGADAITPLNPGADPAFAARKGYYRNPVIAALGEPPEQPMALIAAEHTAQLNAPQNDDVFSKAEENELLFQDVQLTWSRSSRAAAIDVLSSTTTMEVGIDIGMLSGVALRNMPPARANYQQRSGRAGRRGNAVATVVAFGSADSHDEHYFANPDGMIRGSVVDPKLTLDNREITRRHIRAFLLQNYHQDRLPEVDPEQPHDLFSVLGTVADFRTGTGILNRSDFANWLDTHEKELQERIASWMPSELSAADRTALLSEMKSDCLTAIDAAIQPGLGETTTVRDSDDEDLEEDEAVEEPPEEGEELPVNAASTKLLDRLLYRGVLPRYAFPTDVATFHVFDLGRSTRFRPIMRFAPSQGLPIAPSQYAPGKQIWISGKCYSSAAVYSAMPDERYQAWQDRRLYRECRACGFAETVPLDMLDRGDLRDCPACASENSFGPARYWLRPPGFAHPVDVPEVTSPDDMPETSYATRAKLTMQTPSTDGRWVQINERIRALSDRQHLLVSNTGPRHDGYSYCVKCGRIEASSEHTPLLFATHRKPYPDDREPTCEGNGTTRHVVLGTDFITDIVLFSMAVAPPFQLKPGNYPTDVALRTVGETLAKTACLMLEIEPGELMAEYRPALTPAGQAGLEAEIFLYDTLPGGAGFSSQLLDRSIELFQRALSSIKACPENCDSSCYRCLRSFKNKFEHDLLDRHVGAELLEYLLTDEPPAFDAQRVANSTALLCSDLRRQGDTRFKLEVPDDFDYSKHSHILATRRDGKRFCVVLSGPLTPDHPANRDALNLGSMAGFAPIVVNELLVRGNLPAATRDVISKIMS